MRPLYDIVNFNCLGLSALTPVQPPEGTRELMAGAYGIEWEKATVVQQYDSTEPAVLTLRVANKETVFCKLFNRYTCQYLILIYTHTHLILYVTHVPKTTTCYVYILFYPWLEAMDKLMPNPLD